jgi:hypothetical protein
VCVRDPPLCVFSSGPPVTGLSFLLVPLFTEHPPKSQKRIYQRFFPGSLGENDVPGSSGTPGVAAQAQARALLPFSSSGSLTPGQQTAARLSAAPTTGSVRRCGFPLARQGQGAFFLIWAKRLGGPTDCSNSRLAAWLRLPLLLARTELHRVLIAVARRFTAEPGRSLGGEFARSGAAG